MKKVGTDNNTFILDGGGAVQGQEHTEVTPSYYIHYQLNTVVSPMYNTLYQG